MTTGTDRSQAIFQDARELQADALEMLTQGRNPQLCREALGDRRSEPQTPWCAGGRGRLLEGIGETVVAGDLS